MTLKDTLEIDTDDPADWPADPTEWPSELIIRDHATGARRRYLLSLTMPVPEGGADDE